MTLVPLDTSFFDTIAGLPMHPLVVHLAVVFLPLAALMFVVLVTIRPLRGTWAIPALVALAVGTAAAFASKESGEQLANHVGVEATHSFWGGLLPYFAAGLFVVALIWWLVQGMAVRRARTTSVKGPSAPEVVLGALTVILALGVTGLSVVVGHSGASAAWAGRLEPSPSATASAIPTGSASPSESATPTATASSSASTTPSASAIATGYTMAQVQQHASDTSCWTVVSGSVYDMTAWIGPHPGGQAVIEAMCGQDATSRYSQEHGSDRLPASTLATFKLGALAG